MFFKGFHIRFLLLFVICFLAFHLPGQELSTASKRAIKHFEEANRNFNLMYYDLAEHRLQKALRADPQFIEAMMLLADVYKMQNNSGEAAQLYQSVIRIDAEKYPEVYFFLGAIKFNEENYSEALMQFDYYLMNEKSKGRRFEDAVFYRSCADFAIAAMETPVPFEPVNLGEGINSPGNEYINAVSSDELVLFFTGQHGGVSLDSDDFFIAQRISSQSPWPEARRLGPPINTPGQEGALAITPDGRYILFAGCQWPESFGSCDIYAAQRSGNTFSEPANLGTVINTSAWESQPSLSSDGRTLFFASNRSGGFGKSDIWQAYLLDDEKWSNPENPGERINTTGSEMSPFIHPDGQTLYFASDRHPGMGGLDLFISRKDDSGNWSQPVNLGFPINTSGDEMNIVINSPGDKAYISSDRHGGFGGYDIFEFELYDEIRPQPVTYIKGVITDAKTGKPLEAYFSLIDIETGIEEVNSVSDKRTGSFLVCVPVNKVFVLNISTEGYLFYSENIQVLNIHSDMEPRLINIELQPLEKGSKMVLRNIFFETGKYQLRDESKVELKKLLEFLNNYPHIKIEISGHTDNTGSGEFNLTLSENRAKAVYEYLLDKDIASGRMVYKGYGFSRPHSDNASEQGRAANRRTEIEILEVAPE
jgi:outer membrane protein OmpA-like peptidoglycan-associated protein